MNDRREVVVVGFGSRAFGREVRAVTALRHMENVRSLCLVSRWEDGSVSRLLARSGLAFESAPLGYLGLAHPGWSAVTLWHAPRLNLVLLRRWRSLGCRTLVLLDLRSFANCLPAVLWLRAKGRARVVLYLGDILHRSAATASLARLAGSLADVTIVNSHAVRLSLEALGLRPQAIEVVYNGKDIDAFARAAPMPWRAERGWDDGSILTGYIGQFSERKGVFDLAEAAAQAWARDPRLRFVLIGEEDRPGTACRRLRDLFAEREMSAAVMFPGRVEEIERAYAALDLVVVPSRYPDPAPNVALEAMAAARPIIATRAGGIPEMVVHGESGLLVEQAAPQQLADAICRLAGDAELRRRLVRGGTVRARRDFEARLTAQRLEKLVLGR